MGCGWRASEQARRGECVYRKGGKGKQVNERNRAKHSFALRTARLKGKKVELAQGKREALPHGILS